MEFGSYGEAAEYMPQVFGDYNNARLHSAIGYSTPGEFYLKYRKKLVPEVVTSKLQSRKCSKNRGPVQIHATFTHSLNKFRGDVKLCRLSAG